ncbi:hypothetical protein [Aestuariispira insulae]|uniref:Lipoprotein n=1 Tax=Aestuariispira insulae TaxID=1461337 RepID=A0A3D9H3N0_9PROT|nr:hypothetical protein [Aestuariispira insulae]RED44107.1 hypothetical protein DFP90_11710 [Aestuariispira insulae]
MRVVFSSTVVGLLLAGCASGPVGGPKDLHKSVDENNYAYSYVMHSIDRRLDDRMKKIDAVISSCPAELKQKMVGIVKSFSKGTDVFSKAHALEASTAIMAKCDVLADAFSETLKPYDPVSAGLDTVPFKDRYCAKNSESTVCD